MVFQKLFYKHLSKHLAQPGYGPLGWYTMRRMEKVNKHLAVNCVRLLDIQPDDKVLEVGFGTGIGLEASYQYVKDGSGIIYGIDPSRRMYTHVRRRFRKEIKEEKIIVYPVRLPLVPFKTDFFHRIYHTNCYYFWWNMSAACTELHNILKPHGKMVTTLNMDRLKRLKSKGGFHVGDYDPIRYMATLESVGFQNVHMEYLTDSMDKQFENYQAIYAEVGAKSGVLPVSERYEDQSVETDNDARNLDSCEVHLEEAAESVKQENQNAAKVKDKRTQSAVK